MNPWAQGTSHPVTWEKSLKTLLLLTVLTLLVIGGGAWMIGQPHRAAWLWIGGTMAVLAFLVVHIMRSLRRGAFGLDLIAALAMTGALVLGEHLAGIIVALMFTGGQALEDFAQTRARREMTALLDRVPRNAARYSDGQIRDVPLADLMPGDRILVRRGEIVPVDGVVTQGVAVLDESALTGEALPVTRQSGTAVMSGATNAGDAFDIEATSAAADSTYGGIIRLVEAASAAKAPMVRLADRYGLLFFAITLVMTGTTWALSGDPVRALAVLVVATPCPLILAVPVAIMSGISRCAKQGVLIKGGGALEMLGRIRTVIFDKTGTITDGRARLLETRSTEGLDPLELLRLAASLDQSSHHVVAQALVAAARERDLRLETPQDVREQSGAGVTGHVGRHAMAVGGWDYVKNRTDTSSFSGEIESWIRRDGTVAVVVGIDGHVAGAFLLADQIRPEAGTVLRQLRDAGVRRIVLATGDRADLAASVAVFLGVDAMISDLRPQDKTAIVEAEKPNGPVLMTGDGVNDAPALAAADLGVAMGARGAAASSEVADIIILVDRLDRLVNAVRIARRSRAIALQSVYAGMGLSTAAMIAASFGYIVPVEGALLQEAIDVAVILNALRALKGPIRKRGQRGRLSTEDLRVLDAEHHALLDVVDMIRITADRVHDLSGPDIQQELERLDVLLRQRLLPHEQHDDREIYARIRQRADAPDSLAGMSRTHMEIRRQVHNLTSLRTALPPNGPDTLQRTEIERLLYGLEAITRLHFAQEEELYRSMERD